MWTSTVRVSPDVSDAPHLLEQLASREHLALAGHESAQEIELLECQRDGLAVDRDGVGRARQDDGARGQDVARILARRRLSATQQRVHAADQLHHAEGFREVVVGARVEPADGVVFGALRRQHHDGKRLHGGVFANQAEDLEPVGAGKHDVEQNQIGDARLARREELVGLRKAPEPRSPPA